MAIVLTGNNTENVDNDQEQQRLPKPVRDIKDKILTEESRQVEFDELRRKLFKVGVYTAVAGYGCLVIMLLIVVGGYMYSLIFTFKELPSNFWHLPLIVCLVATTTLYLILKLSSGFGKEIKETENDKEFLFSEVDTTDFPAVVLFKEGYQSIIDNVKKIKNIFKSKE